jgi:hypothetical protein
MVPTKLSNIVTAFPESPDDRAMLPDRPDNVVLPSNEPSIVEPRSVTELLPGPNILLMFPSILSSAASTVDDSRRAPSGVDAILSKFDRREGMVALIPDLVLSVLSPSREDMLLVKSPPRYPFTKSIMFREFLDMIPPTPCGIDFLLADASYSHTANIVLWSI